MSNSDTESPPEKQLVIGRVKFYNRNRMFGFITYDVLKHKPNEQKDVFVHSSAIEPRDVHDCANYLKEGEYVEFYVEKTKRGTVATSVRGVGDGPLLMDSEQKTRRKTRPHTRASSYAGDLSSESQREQQVVVEGSE